MTTDIVKQIRKATRRRFTAEEKIRIVLEGLRGEIPIRRPLRETKRRRKATCGRDQKKSSPDLLRHGRSI